MQEVKRVEARKGAPYSPSGITLESKEGGQKGKELPTMEISKFLQGTMIDKGPYTTTQFRYDDYTPLNTN